MTTSIKEETQILYLVKFDRGYYAEKQPRYNWSFTDDPMLAKKYKMLKNAKEKGEWGIQLNTNPLQSYVIEKCTVTTKIELEGIE